MTFNGWLQIIITVALIFATAKPLGDYYYRVYTGQPTLLGKVFGRPERLFYRAIGTDPQKEMRWTTYAFAFLASNIVGFLFLFVLLQVQGHLPLNPQHFKGMDAPLAFNTTMSFVTNTNWQAYGGETTLSYFSQMAGLTVQNFISAAGGMAIAVAFCRAWRRRNVSTIGNYWVDLTRGTLYILLPIAVLVSVILMSQGVVQTIAGYPTVTSALDGTQQVLARGPAAFQVAIKQLGTNGGGFFNTNSAHPFENPTPFSNLVETWAIISLSAAFPFLFGRYVRKFRQGLIVFVAMAIIYIAGILVVYPAEQAAAPTLVDTGVSQAQGNMEGKEVRFGIAPSAIWAVTTTVTSNGSVNSMHDSYSPLGGMVPMFNIMLGEVIFGGVGVGLNGMLIYAIIAVFIGGLMVGRTPEFLGKKIQAYEMKMATLYILFAAFGLLIGAGISSVITAGTESLTNAGPHGLSEMLYAWAEAIGNNGSAFAGLSANTNYWNTMLGVGIWIGRYLAILPVLAIAGSLVAKKR
ncbi:MAG: potassium-transporting ATPase subunit KdpA, partial [Chloroflexota bacterium]|nr:potassium-transporting ATPase subunit KdpA [Chloroflexota bacterium]